MFDLMVIGGGVAGLAAAARVASAGFSCIVIDPMGGGGELMNLGRLQDCDDIAPGLNGPDFGAELLQKALEAQVELAIGTVTELRWDKTWTAGIDGESHEAKTVLLASGLIPGTTGLPNETQFEGAGLSHCAACDGPLYTGLPVVVVGHNRWALHEAEELSSGCSKVTLITQGAMPVSKAGLDVCPGIVTGLAGDPSLQEVTVEVGGTRSAIPARGLFIQHGRSASLPPALSGIEVTSAGLVRTDKKWKTAMPRAFAAGSIRLGADTTIRDVLADANGAAEAIIEELAAFQNA